MSINRISFAMLVMFSIAVITAAVPGSGTIQGKVTYTGTPAKPKPIDMSKEPSCAKMHSTPATTANAVTGPGNSLEYVVVYISAGPIGDVTASAGAVSFDQKGCEYLPHVVAVQVGQEIKITNSDQTSHNINAMSRANPPWNKSQPPGAPPITEKFDKEEFVPVKCNVHPWMHGYFAVLKTSHFAVSDSNGGYMLPNLPPGKYTVSAWQESYGTQTQEVTIGAGESKTVNFVFQAKPY
jgi:plastocyanin